MMKRDLCIAEIIRHRTTEIVAAVYGAAFDLLRLQPHPLNFVSFGAMGLLSSQALGLAIGCPDRKVLVIDGDGSLLMNLGTLVTIGEAAPVNFVHFVCENGSYEANGGHPIPGANRVDFARLAEASGYRHTYVFDDLTTLTEQIRSVLDQDGPTFVTLKVEAGEDSPHDWGFIHGPLARSQFRDALKA